MPDLWAAQLLICSLTTFSTTALRSFSSCIPLTFWSSSWFYLVSYSNCSRRIFRWIEDCFVSSFGWDWSRVDCRSEFSSCFDWSVFYRELMLHSSIDWWDKSDWYCWDGSISNLVTLCFNFIKFMEEYYYLTYVCLISCIKLLFQLIVSTVKLIPPSLL